MRVLVFRGKLDEDVLLDMRVKIRSVLIDVHQDGVVVLMSSSFSLPAGILARRGLSEEDLQPLEWWRRRVQLVVFPVVEFLRHEAAAVLSARFAHIHHFTPIGLSPVTWAAMSYGARC